MPIFVFVRGSAQTQMHASLCACVAGVVVVWIAFGVITAVEHHRGAEDRDTCTCETRAYPTLDSVTTVCAPEQISSITTIVSLVDTRAPPPPEELCADAAYTVNITQVYAPPPGVGFDDFSLKILTDDTTSTTISCAGAGVRLVNATHSALFVACKIVSTAGINVANAIDVRITFFAVFNGIPYGPVETFVTQTNTPPDMAPPSSTLCEDNLNGVRASAFNPVTTCA